MTLPSDGWRTYVKTHPTFAVKLPKPVTIPTREGEVEGEAGDYLCIDADGGLYPCDAETLETMYEPAGDDIGGPYTCSTCGRSHDGEHDCPLEPEAES